MKTGLEGPVEPELPGVGVAKAWKMTPGSQLGLGFWVRKERKLGVITSMQLEVFFFFFHS